MTTTLDEITTPATSSATRTTTTPALLPATGPADRCTGRRCGHTRAAHVGRPGNQLREPTGCAVLICGCETFRSELDR